MTVFFPKLTVGEFIDLNDSTKSVSFGLPSLNTGIALAFEFEANSTQSITLPDQVGTVVGEDCPQTLTNKDLSDASNHVVANAVRAGTGSIPIVGTPTDLQVPVYSQSLNQVVWRTPGARALEAHSTTPETAFSDTYAQVTGMQLTPTVEGPYIVTYDARISTNGPASWAIFVNGGMVTYSERSVPGATETAMNTQCVVVDWTTGNIELRWIPGLAGSTVNQRSFVAIRLAMA